MTAICIHSVSAYLAIFLKREEYLHLDIQSPGKEGKHIAPKHTLSLKMIAIITRCYFVCRAHEKKIFSISSPLGPTTTAIASDR